MKAEIWNWDFAARILPSLLEAFLTTLKLAALGGIGALILGLTWAIILQLRPVVLTQIVQSFVNVVRSTPLLVQLYVAFYVLPGYGLLMSPEVTGVVGLSIYFSGYMTAVFQVGIRSIEQGQWEAAKVLGLSPLRTWQAIILPQATARVLPPIGSYLLMLLKESSMLSAISVSELLHEANTIGSDNFRYVEPLTMAALLYLSISFPFAVALRKLEVHLAR